GNRNALARRIFRQPGCRRPRLRPAALMSACGGRTNKWRALAASGSLVPHRSALAPRVGGAQPLAGLRVDADGFNLADPGPLLEMVAARGEFPRRFLGKRVLNPKCVGHPMAVERSEEHTSELQSRGH